MKLIFHKCTRKDIQTYSVKKKCGVRCTLNGTGIVSKDTLRINGLNRSDRKESFLSLTVPQMYRNIKIKEKKSIDTSLALKNPHLEIGITALVNLVPHYMASFIISQSVSFLRKFYTLPWSILAVQVWLVLRLDRYCVGLLLMFLFFLIPYCCQLQAFLRQRLIEMKSDSDILSANQVCCIRNFLLFFCSFFIIKKCLQSKEEKETKT